MLHFLLCNRTKKLQWNNRITYKHILWLKDVDQIDRHRECSYDIEQVDQYLLIRIWRATFRWLAASMSGHVKSQAKLWPRDQDIRLASCYHSGTARQRRRKGISAESKARLITPLTAVCLAMRPLDFFQLRPWSPLMSTVAPHTHWCSVQDGELRQCEGTCRPYACRLRW